MTRRVRGSGSVTHRCKCSGKPKCPGPVDGHGSWYYCVDAGHGADGKRVQVRRGGFKDETAAMEAAKRRISLVPSTGSEWKSQAYRMAAASMLSEDIVQFSFSGGDEGHVYVILAGVHLKIGFSRDPEERLRSIRYAKPDRLILPNQVDLSLVELWWSHPGTREDERRLQNLARNYWISGEWYQADPQLIRGLNVVRDNLSEKVEL